MNTLRSATLALAITYTIVVLPGCTTEENVTAPPTETVLTAPTHEWVIGSERVTGDELRTHRSRMSYPLQLGNRWKYTAHVIIEAHTDAGTEPPKEIIRTTKAEIVGAESLSGRCYAIEERSITEDISPGDVFSQRVFFRQDDSGLYEADVPIGDRPPGPARPSTIDPFNDYLEDRDQGTAWVRTHRELQDRADVVRNLRNGGPVSGRGRIGPMEDELTRLDYPLRHGHQWVVIDDAFLMTATVEGREVLDLPIGRTPGWRVRLESDIFGPEDEVYLFYGRLGYLGWRLMVASEVVGDDGASMGTLWFTDEEYLQDVEIDRKAELPCEAAPPTGPRTAESSL
jgi:hypothetical protein